MTQNRHSDYNNLASTEDKAVSTIMYFGGIVGGIEKWENETPELTITDCSGFEVFDKDSKYHGGILGYADNDGSKNSTKDCQGNWWPNKSDGKASKGVAAWQSGVTADTTIGKRNAVKPAE
jgi:hypothetical protein